MNEAESLSLVSPSTTMAALLKVMRKAESLGLSFETADCDTQFVIKAGAEEVYRTPYFIAAVGWLDGATYMKRVEAPK